MKNNSLVYCPKCGEVTESNLLYCPKCKESLKGAAEADPHELRRYKRRLKAEKRNIRARERKEKRNALFKKYPFLKPLLYVLAVLVALGLIALLWKIATVSILFFVIAITAILLTLYIWYAAYVLNNLGHFSSRIVERFSFGAVAGGFLLIVMLLYLIYILITEGI